jgi:hypothetical protein
MGDMDAGSVACVGDGSVIGLSNVRRGIRKWY